MRCLLRHKWVRKATDLRSGVPIRTCEHCGTMQRGIYDPFWRDISWETIRERVFIGPTQVDMASEPNYPGEATVDPNRIPLERFRFVRKPSSRLDQWAHSLRLRRSRAGDRPD